jgi:hypothetical protein
LETSVERGVSRVTKKECRYARFSRVDAAEGLRFAG